MKRFVVVGLTVALGLGALGAESIGAASGAEPFAAPMRSTTVTCANVSGFLIAHRGITTAPIPAGTVAAFEWKMKAVATGCTATPSSSAGYSGTIAGAIVTASGFVQDPSATSLCAAAAGAPNTWNGVSPSKIQWIATPAVGNTVLPAGTLGAPAELDTTGLEIHWPITGSTFLDIGGDYPSATPCPPGPLPSTTHAFGTPSTPPHVPAFQAVL